MQDYFATTVVLAAEQGVAAAKQTPALGDQLSRRAISSPRPRDSTRISASPTGSTPTSPVPARATPIRPGHRSRAGVKRRRQQRYRQHDSNWTNTDGYYASLARASLAGDITVTALTRGDGCLWLDHRLRSAGRNRLPALIVSAFDIAPRLPDGQFLTSDHIIVSSDTIAAHLQGSNADQLIYETGSGNVTITGGTGINLLFAGSGNDTLLGGPNRDYLFGGSGTDILSAGAGNNYLEPGTGAAKLLLAAADSASDLIANFKVGIDHLVVTDLAGHPATAPEISAIIAGATTNASGAAVLHLSATHDVTLQNIVAGQLTSSLFG